MTTLRLKFLKNDLIAGFSVFLLALPLSLGIAIASGFPPVSGLLTAILGGVLVSFLGSAKLSIKGPAAGLIVIVLGAVQDLGQGDFVLGYKRALAVGVVAAVLQIAIALGRKALVIEIMPPSVVRGMLAAIGVIILAKQIHMMMGVTPVSKTTFGLLFEVPQSFALANPKIFLIGILALSVSLIWFFFKKLTLIPASFVVISLAIVLSVFFQISEGATYSFFNQTYVLNKSFLMELPQNILQALAFPDFSMIGSWVSLKYIILYTLIGSIESLLAVCALDNFSQEKKQSDLNKDLLATGLGNLVSSFIGGMPMISEIVRTKANVDAGAKTQYANVFHGLFLILAVVLFPNWLGQIPYAALAALLVYVGFRLASLKEFHAVYQLGKDQFLFFLVTFLVTLFTDLLWGVAFGLVFKIALHTYRAKSLKNLFVLNFNQKVDQDQLILCVKGPLVFFHYLKLKKLIEQSLISHKKTVLNLNQITFVDHAILQKLFHLKNEVQNHQFEILGLDNMKKKTQHILSVRKRF